MQVSGWDITTLQQIIDNCDAGDSGMDKCPGLIGGINDPSTSCNIQSAVPETISGVLAALPGNNPPSGWGQGSPPVAPPAGSSTTPNVVPPTSIPVPVASPTSAPAGIPPYTPPAEESPTTAAPTIPSAPTDYPSAPTDYPTTIPTDQSPPLPSDSPPVNPIPTPSPTSTSTPPPPSTNPSNPPSSPPSDPLPVGSVSVPGWTYSGCFSDSASTRALTGINLANLGRDNVTSTGCINYCAAQGFTIAGTEWSSQCFCGDSLASGSVALAESQCAMPCIADASEICGGSLSLSIFQVSPSEGTGAVADLAATDTTPTGVADATASSTTATDPGPTDTNSWSPWRRSADSKLHRHARHLRRHGIGGQSGAW